MGIPDCPSCFLRSLYTGQEAKIGTGHGTMDWSKIGKGVHQGCILSPCLFNLCEEYIRFPRWVRGERICLQFRRCGFYSWVRNRSLGEKKGYPLQYFGRGARWQNTALTYHFSNLEPVCCSMSGSNCCFLTCIQMSQEAGKVAWYSHF